MEDELVKQSQLDRRMAELRTQMAERDGASGAAITRLHEEVIFRDSSLKDQIQASVVANDLRVREAFAAAEKAIDKQDSASEKRFDSINEFRAQLTDQAAEFVRQDLYSASNETIRKDVELLKQQIAAGGGVDAGAADQTRRFYGAVAVLVSAAALISPHIH